MGRSNIRFQICDKSGDEQVGAIVRIKSKDTDQFSVTDIDGIAEFYVKADTYHISISYTGYSELPEIAFVIQPHTKVVFEETLGLNNHLIGHILSRKKLTKAEQNTIIDAIDRSGKNIGIINKKNYHIAWEI